MTVLDRDVDIKIADSTYKILYSNRALIQVERECLEGSLPVMMVNVGKAMAYSNVFVLFKYGMLAGNPGVIAEADIEDLFYQAVDSYGDYVHVGEKCYEALMKCGFIKSQKNSRASAQKAE